MNEEDELQKQLDEAAQTPILLLASDYDGTLAPIVDDPAKAQANRESVVALKALATMSQTHVAVISGRALTDLARHLHDAENAHLVGSHGSEFETPIAQQMPPEKSELLKQIVIEARKISEKTPGTSVEVKPAGVAFHYRNADEQAGLAAAENLLDSLSKLPGLHVRRGKMVVELSVLPTDKGRAIDTLRQRLGPTTIIFLGDDTTDEDAFKKLVSPDIGIKVGPGDTAAKFRVQDTNRVAALLARLAERRAAWLAGSQAPPIERHSLLSDQRTFALVDPRGRISWLCLPRCDSAALLAELVGGPAAGFFEIAPADPPAEPPHQQYLGSSFLLSTDWGSLRVIDYLDCSAGRPFQRAGRTDLIRVIEGSGKAKITFAPRMHFGAVETELRMVANGLELVGAVDPCVLVAPGIQWTIQEEGHHENAIGEVDVKDGSPVVLELRYGTASFASAQATESTRRQQTDRFWSAWAATLKLPPRYTDQVRRSALILRALSYGPTGAIAAAATTSLPEHLGGVRNWDYRYCWPRDAAIAAAALLSLGAGGPAMKMLDWILGLLEGAEPNTLIRPVYTVTGGHLPVEATIPGLTGYRGSRPVRIGNEAAHQVQLDVLGPIAHLLSMQAAQGASLTPEHWRLTETMVRAVADRWKEEDHGIWELRASRRSHVHSRVMCWVTVDCAMRIAEYMGYSRPEWPKLRQEIADDVLDHGWNPKRNAFCASYGSDDIDAATLSVGLSGLLPPSDPRFLSTVQAVESELLDGGTVYRYRYEDGLPGLEGGFNFCTSWLIQAYAMLGRWKEAEELFNKYCALAGPTGLMAEEFDPSLNLALGNIPQAYSHAGLISCALRLCEPR